MASKPSEETLKRDALKAVEEARSRGLVLRIMGALAVRIHTESLSALHRRLARLGPVDKEFTDIDMVTYKSQRQAVHKLLTDFGYTTDRLVMAYFGETRFAYHHPENLYHVDLFFEELRFSHDIDLGKPGKGRLELDYPTITLADLLLEKLQIHEINEKDLKDLIVILRGHGLANEDSREAIDLRRLASVLSHDWGFWFDTNANLKKVVEQAQKHREDGLLEEEDLQDLQTKIGRIVTYLDEVPKSKEWLKRAKDGTEKKWWKDVEEIYR